MKYAGTLFPLILSMLLLPLSAQAICVKAKKANMRSGPGTNHAITWEVYKYMPLIQLKKQGDWLQVKDFEGDTHWIYKNLTTSSYKCAVVKVDKANLRTGPGTKYGKPKDLPVVEKYMTFKFLRSQGDWAQIMDTYNDKYWVFRKLIWVY
jgi:SH3-like domain-containing protein